MLPVRYRICRDCREEETTVRQHHQVVAPCQCRAPRLLVAMRPTSLIVAFRLRSGTTIRVLNGRARVLLSLGRPDRRIFQAGRRLQALLIRRVVQQRSSAFWTETTPDRRLDSWSANGLATTM